MSPSFRNLIFTAFVCLTAAGAVHAQSAETANVTSEAVAAAQTTTFCEIQNSPSRFKNKMVRVRALYETDFEKSIITAPSCNTPFPTTWVDFDKLWESRTKRGVRRALSKLKWRFQSDVVFIGLIKADGHYGHMDLYPLSIEVFKVEAVRASGRFRPLP